MPPWPARGAADHGDDEAVELGDVEDVVGFFTSRGLDTFGKPGQVVVERGEFVVAERRVEVEFEKGSRNHGSGPAGKRRGASAQ